MECLLDTNAVIALLHDPRSPLARRVRQRRPADVVISAIVLHELYFGAFRSQRVTHNLAIVEALRFPALEFGVEDAREAGAVRAILADLGTPIGPFDALIAGQARARGLLLVTRNTREFARVPGLRVENWEDG